MYRLQQECTITCCHTPLPSSPSSTPFEAVFSDYGWHHYLVVRGRLSEWLEVLSSTATTSRALTALCITAYSSEYLVCQRQLPGDGGLDFTAESSIVSSLLTSPSLMAEPKWQWKWQSAFWCPTLAQETSTKTASYVLCYNCTHLSSTDCLWSPPQNFLCEPTWEAFKPEHPVALAPGMGCKVRWPACINDPHSRIPKRKLVSPPATYNKWMSLPT